MLWYNIPMVLSTILIAICTALILMSMVLYIIKYARIISKKQDS